MAKCKSCERIIPDQLDIYCEGCMTDIFDYFADKCEYLACDPVSYTCTHKDNTGDGDIGHEYSDDIPEGEVVHRCFEWTCPLMEEFEQFMKDW